MQDEAQVRREKLARLEQAGCEPYALTTERDTLIGQAQTNFETWSAEAKEVVLAGRVMTIRAHGAMMFADVMDESGRLQIAFKQDEIGEETFKLFFENIDPGDIVEVRGTLFVTKRGERTLSVKAWKILVKALLPLPEKFHGLQDIETRYRQRELDLLSNPEVRQNFIFRSKLVAAMRRYLDERGFLEVETPVLHPIAGGAAARPFVTHHNALDSQFFLRIAPELYLKRLIVGGFEKVYEVARCFRNEGIDHAHNPEFTQIELYWAFAKPDEFLSFMENMLSEAMQATLGTTKVVHEQGVLDFVAPWPRVTFKQVIADACRIDIGLLQTVEDVEKACRAVDLKIDFSKTVGLGEALDELYKKVARPQIIQPTWVMDYPAVMKPLANRHPDDPIFSTTAQLVCAGAEIINAYYHEMNNPIEQRHIFEEQQALREAGSEEAQKMDKLFLESLEQGMPPTSGFGMGIDRLCALLLGLPNLKEVILFPTLRPKQDE